MDRYVKKKKIGEGSFGKAILVQSKADGKEYVVKEISISKMKRKEREESKKEVAVLKQMKHPNIVSYQESFEELGNLYIVMDYCDGGDLYKAINSQRGILFVEDKVLDWFVQICLAIKHVHDRKILHRDLKSQNIFLTRKGIVKLGDFGIARVLNSTVELARTCIGTPYYLSPEICENRPYNNKSDIWALGCVLYEICTLKHAFEAGNMKNLVLKIIRGSYPPVSPRYSYELRNLIALLFKRNPRDRPSINTILKKPLMQKRIQKFLTETQASNEFSHTILHRKRPGAPSVGGARPLMAPPVRKPVQPVRVSNPSAKYGVSVAARKPPSAGAKRVPVHKVMDNKDFEKRKQELMAKEKERRNQNLQLRVRQQKLADKQQMDRINRARETGWKSTLSSSGDGSNGQEPSYDEPPRKEPKMDDDGGKRPWIDPRPAKQERGKYDHYHDYLDNLKQGAKVEPAFGGIAYKRQAQDNAWPDREQIRNRPVSASAAEAAKKAAENRVFAANAANKGKEAHEFWERKRQAAMNKARGNAQMMGWAEPARQKENQQANQQNAYHNKDEQDYLERLKAIRVQNYNERRQIQKQQGGGFGGDAVKASIGDPRVDADARRKKIEALKAQADQRAAKLKEELARKRQEAFEREKQHRDEHLRKMAGGRPAVRAPVQPVKGPVAKVLGITEALKQIESDEGVEVQEERLSAIEKENQKVPERRKQWGAGDCKALPFDNMPLEITASGMEATGVADAVVKHDQGKEHINAAAGRKHWAGHADTVLNALQGRQLAVETSTFAPPQPGSRMGVTVVKDSVKAPVPKSPIQPGTITISKEVKKTTDNTSEESIETINTTEKIAEKQEETGEEKPKGKAAWGDANKEDNSAQQTEAKSEANTKDGTDGDKAGNEAKKTDSIKKTNTPRSVRPSWERKLNQPDDTEENKTKNDSLNISGGQKSPRSPIPPWLRKSAEDNPTIKKEADDSDLSVSLDAKSSKSPRSQIPPWQRKSLPNTEENQTAADGLKKSPEVCVDVASKSPRPQPDKASDGTPARKNIMVDIQDQDPESGAAIKSSDVNVSAKDVFESLKNEAEELQTFIKKETASGEDLGLISQVDLADDEELIVGSDSSLAEGLGGSTLVTGLQTGHFDTDVRILRTCSEPDLCKLFRTTLAMNPFLEIHDGQPEDDIQLEDAEDAEEEEDDDEESEENEDQAEVDEDELYQSMLENMESVLTHMDEKKEDDMKETLENEVEEAVEEETKKEQKSTPPVVAAAATYDDEDEEDDDDEDGSSCHVINEDWDSGDGEDDDILEKDDDLFCRLEESRVELEKELGCDTFLQVYKSIQAIHEDEDENIEEGTQIANKLLGKEKTHLYTKIFQLVMADSAFTENNE